MMNYPLNLAPVVAAALLQMIVIVQTLVIRMTLKIRHTVVMVTVN